MYFSYLYEYSTIEIVFSRFFEFPFAATSMQLRDFAYIRVCACSFGSFKAGSV